jgi:hypothetical protein
MPPTYVKTYVKRQKNDMVDAEAICEAVQRDTPHVPEHLGMRGLGRGPLREGHYGQRS